MKQAKFIVAKNILGRLGRRGLLVSMSLIMGVTPAFAQTGPFFQPGEEDQNLIFGGNEWAPLGDGFATCQAGGTGNSALGDSNNTRLTGQAQSDIWQYFLNRGFTEAQAAGIMGNLSWESGGLNPAAVNPSSGATGLAQWLGSRLDNLRSYATARGLEHTSLEAQLDFLMYELTGDSLTPEIAQQVMGVPGAGTENAAYQDIVTRNDVDSAAASWAMLFERYTEAIQYRRETRNAVGNDPQQQIPPPAGFQDLFDFAFNTRPTSGEGSGGGPRIDLARQIFAENTGNFAPTLTCSGFGGTDTIGDVEIGNTAHILCPAGTEDQGEADGYLANVRYTIRICNIGAVRGINSVIASAVQALLADSTAQGVDLGGGGFRDMASQISLRRSNCGTSDYAIYEMPASQCSPPTARPGFSNHQMGVAIDFTYNGRTICFNPRSIRRSNVCATTGNRGFNWLNANAGRYGLINLPSEAWHWSINGK